MIRVQTEDFNLADEYAALQSPGVTGAIVTFVGRVRDFGPGTFILKHYPGMTENVLKKIEAEAHTRWPLLNSTIIHRVGKLNIDEQIVFVGVASSHRDAAFSACQFMMDILKTEAPFWKKEGDTWVDAKTQDQAAADRWLND